MSDLPERHGIRPAQVLAAALAAVTAAFLGSRLGVYGTVVGAGVVSLATTVGGEFYLRSLERTKQAAKRTKDVALTRTTRANAVDTADPDDERVTEGPPAGRRVRWPMLAGGAVVAFVLGMGAVTGIEALTGSSLSGERGGTVSNVLGGRPQQAPVDRDEPAGPPPATSSSSSQPPSSSSRPPSSARTTSKPTATAPPSESTAPTEPPASTTTEPEPTTSEPIGARPLP